MTARHQEQLVGLLKWLLPIAVAVGVSWGSLGASVSRKLDAPRFEMDSVRRDAQHAADAAERTSDHQLLLRIDARVSAMYCATIPDSLRTGCR